MSWSYVLEFLTGRETGKEGKQRRQTSKIECFAKIVGGFKPLTTFAKFPISDVWQDSEYTSWKESSVFLSMQ